MRLIILLILLLSWLEASSQEPTISFPNGSILFVGIENKIKISTRKDNCRNIFISVNQGTLTGNDCNYLYKIQKNQKSATFKVGIILNQDSIVTDTAEVQLQIIPDPDLAIAGINEICIHKIGTAIIPVWNKNQSQGNNNFNLYVKRYNLKWSRNDSIIKTMTVDTMLIPYSIEREAKKGDKLIFDKIELICPASASRLSTIVLVILLMSCHLNALLRSAAVYIHAEKLIIFFNFSNFRCLNSGLVIP